MLLALALGFTWLLLGSLRFGDVGKLTALGSLTDLALFSTQVSGDVGSGVKSQLPSRNPDSAIVVHLFVYCTHMNTVNLFLLTSAHCIQMP